MKFISLVLFFITLTAAAKPMSDKHDIQMKNFNEDSAEIVSILNDTGGAFFCKAHGHRLQSGRCL
jgi:hypothetical protein